MLKGRKFLLILFLAGLSMVLLGSVSLPFNFTTRAVLPLGLARTMEQLENPAQLRKWVLPFANTITDTLAYRTRSGPGIRHRDDSVLILESMPGNSLLEFYTDGKNRQYEFLVNRVPGNMKGCMVSMTINTTAWKRFIDPLPIDEQVINSLHNLERFANDTRRFYGYNIREGRVQDSILLFITASVPASDQYSTAMLLFDSLIRFSNNRNLRFKGNRYFNRQNLDNGQVQLSASIGINSPFATTSADALNKKPLPYGSRQIEIDYRGPYHGMEQVYRALDQYKRDHAIINTLLPMEEFLSPGYAYRPDDSVSIKLCVPYTPNL